MLLKKTNLKYNNVILQAMTYRVSLPLNLRLNLNVPNIFLNVYKLLLCVVEPMLRLI